MDAREIPHVLEYVHVYVRTCPWMCTRVHDVLGHARVHVCGISMCMYTCIHVARVNNVHTWTTTHACTQWHAPPSRVCCMMIDGCTIRHAATRHAARVLEYGTRVLEHTHGHVYHVYQY